MWFLSYSSINQAWGYNYKFKSSQVVLVISSWRSLSSRSPQVTSSCEPLTELKRNCPDSTETCSHKEFCHNESRKTISSRTCGDIYHPPDTLTNVFLLRFFFFFWLTSQLRHNNCNQNWNDHLAMGSLSKFYSLKLKEDFGLSLGKHHNYRTRLFNCTNWWLINVSILSFRY